MAYYVSLGSQFSDIAYQVNAALLPSIRGAVNQLLFSYFPSKLIKLCLQKNLFDLNECGARLLSVGCLFRLMLFNFFQAVTFHQCWALTR